MKVYKLKGKTTCAACENDADFYLDGFDAVLCKDCALELYKSLGTMFIPRSIPNVILRSEKQVVKEILQTEQIDAEEIKKTVKTNKSNENREESGVKANPQIIKTRRTKWQRKNRK